MCLEVGADDEGQPGFSENGFCRINRRFSCVPDIPNHICRVLFGLLRWFLELVFCLIPVIFADIECSLPSANLVKYFLTI